MSKVMIAKYPCKCCICDEAIQRGQVIAFYGRGQAAHNECEQEQSAEHPQCEDTLKGLEPGTLANDRRMAKRGLSITRYQSGYVSTVNSKGRCEDAPCCGCCT